MDDNPVSRIFESVPEFQNLSISLKSHVYRFLERRIEKLAIKIRHSPYEPRKSADVLQVNRNFPAALEKWLGQFPAEHKLGLLAAVLSTTYITHSEQELFLDIAMEGLRESILLQEKFSYVPGASLPSVVRSKIRAWPISHFGAYDDFIHKLPIEATL